MINNPNNIYSKSNSSLTDNENSILSDGINQPMDEKSSTSEVRCPFTQELNALILKIKKSTEAELPELKKSLLELFDSQPILGQESILKKSIEAFTECTTEEIKQIKKIGKEYISTHPWHAVSLAGLVGFFIATSSCKKQRYYK